MRRLDFARGRWAARIAPFPFEDGSVLFVEVVGEAS